MLTCFDLCTIINECPIGDAFCLTINAFRSTLTSEIMFDLGLYSSAILILNATYALRSVNVLRTGFLSEDRARRLL